MTESGAAPGPSRSVVALACLGVGLIHIAVGAGSPLALAVVALGFGAAELGWGVTILVRGRFVAPRALLTLGLLPTALWALTMVLSVTGGASSGTLPFVSMAGATALGLSIAAILAVSGRRGWGGTADAADPSNSASAAVSTDQRPWRFLGGMLIGAFAVSGIVTPALAASNAGDVAVPHGEHGTVQVDSHHGH